MSNNGRRRMSNMEFSLLAVDGGGTKTLAVITDSVGKIKGHGRSDASNYQVTGIEGAKAAIEAAIIGAVKNVSEKKQIVRFQTGVFALAGIDTPADQAVVNRIVTVACNKAGVIFDRLIIENDALSALLGATSNYPGALMISGTGSIAFAHDGKGQCVRSGGWGHTFGDEGSGYWIGKEAIRAILKMNDGRGPNTRLKDRVLEAINLRAVEDLYNWVYSSHGSVDAISEIAKLVEICGDEGDAVSITILDQAAEELFTLLSTVMEKAAITNEDNSIILQGGVLKHNLYIQKRLMDKAAKDFPKCRFVTSDLDPIEYIVRRGLLINKAND
ncbi:N-acetylglucosamine kinase [Metabacillus arenae]|uniref:ATPase BadF/BadG/BcrA/BcrD type domain-containing protein n=1 Tax=Metabacillus arenae TaxID=2771434 RepID=A0A926NH84_9BACI|nr:BadF/BadG/BcrA/BcrD ATPase family protein [Metabacillus arenae]MBD1383414.1 hypothetical protein [Metabacillus arenae]